jgi:hypothetical protein
MEFRKNLVCDGGIFVKELSEEFKLSAAIEDFGVGQNEIAPDSIEL